MRYYKIIIMLIFAFILLSFSSFGSFHLDNNYSYNFVPMNLKYSGGNNNYYSSYITSTGTIYFGLPILGEIHNRNIVIDSLIIRAAETIDDDGTYINAVHIKSFSNGTSLPTTLFSDGTDQQTGTIYSDYSYYVNKALDKYKSYVLQIGIYVNSGELHLTQIRIKFHYE